MLVVVVVEEEEEEEEEGCGCRVVVVVVVVVAVAVVAVEVAFPRSTLCHVTMASDKAVGVAGGRVQILAKTAWAWGGIPCTNGHDATAPP